MMFAFDFERLNAFLKTVLQRNLSPDTFRWLENEGKSIRANGEIAKFNIAFVSMPRKTGKNSIQFTAEEAAELKALRKGLVMEGWTADRLSRVWLLMQVNPEEKEKYVATLENLFLSAEMSELVALYSSLPVLAFPESWVKRCAEGIRSNIGQVLEAVICNNPYPSEQLDEAAWNQLVLKAIFTEKPVLDIIGLKERSNRNLARALSDYAHERWAAHRDVNPLLWICVSPFIDQNNFSDIQRLISSQDPLENQAAALICYESSYEPAKQLIAQNGELKNNIENGKTTWSGISLKMREKVT